METPLEDRRPPGDYTPRYTSVKIQRLNKMAKRVHFVRLWKHVESCMRCDAFQSIIAPSVSCVGLPEWDIMQCSQIPRPAENFANEVPRRGGAPVGVHHRYREVRIEKNFLQTFWMVLCTCVACWSRRWDLD